MTKWSHGHKWGDPGGSAKLAKVQKAFGMGGGDQDISVQEKD